MDSFLDKLVENPGEPYDLFAFMSHKVEIISPYVSDFIASLPGLVQSNIPNARFYLIILSVFLLLFLLFVIRKFYKVLREHRKLSFLHIPTFLSFGDGE